MCVGHPHQRRRPRSYVLAIFPGSLAGLSAEIEVYAREHPCQSHQTQTNQLGVAQRLDSSNLIELTKQRMQVTAADCLDVAEVEAAAAVERLAVKVAPIRVTQSSPPPQQPGPTALRSAQVAAEVTAPEAQSAAPLPDRLESSSPEMSNHIAAAMGPPEQPSTTPASRPTALPRREARTPEAGGAKC